MAHGERLNCLTHLVGLGLAAVGAVFLVAHASPSGDILKIISFSIFGTAMIALYAASTLFHSMSGPRKDRWAKADHCAIYLLIAGTYTPFSLVTLHGPQGWILFGFVWCLAALGICRELWGGHGLPALPLYLLMGWSGLATAIPLAKGLHGAGWWWLLGGCLSYSLGVVFYLLGRRMPHAHGIWHLFVMGGTASHYVTVFRFVT
jgi:hemolysin III